MGRGTKELIAANGLDRRILGHYRTPPEIADFIASQVRLVNPHGATALDPCTGTGTLLQPLRALGVETTGVDLVDWRLHDMDHFIQTDFLKEVHQDEGLISDSAIAFSSYDYFVLNPPYNCHESDYVRDNKSWLASTFGEIGIANMYAMFIAGVIKVAKPGAVIGLISLDSFLTARLHEPLRALIRETCEIRTIVLCPLDLFRGQGAEVRTCVMILQKKGGPSVDAGAAATLDRPRSSDELFEALGASAFEMVEPSALVLADSRDRGEFTVGLPDSIRRLFDGPRLGEVFACVTGVSTGNDARFLSKEASDVNSIPFYKNPAARRFAMDPDGYLPTNYMELSTSVPSFMVRNKRVATSPGVSCSSMGVTFSAVLRPAGIAYGVNPNIICSEDDAAWLTAFLNSRLVTYLVRGVLLRTNMVTSGYVARLPLPELSLAARTALSAQTEAALVEGRTAAQSDKVRDDIDSILFGELNIPDSVSEMIRAFDHDLVRRV